MDPFGEIKNYFLQLTISDMSDKIDLSIFLINFFTLSDMSGMMNEYIRFFYLNVLFTQ